MRKRILVVGPGKKTEGGITAVIKEYENTELWNNFKCVWIETYNNRNSYLKIKNFISGFLKFIILVPFCKIVHIHFSWKISVIRKMPFFMLAKIFKKKIIIHLHSGAEPIMDSGVKSIYKFFFEKADITILLAHEIKNQLLKEFKFKKIVVVYNPCLVKAEYGNLIRQQNILFAGHINKNKGIFDLLLAFSKINKLYPTWKLLIAGSGDIQKMNEFILKLKIEDQTEFLGWIKGQIKSDVFSNCSIFCLPSYTEGFPMAVIDAWAYGVPVITTPVGGLPDVLEHGVNAMVFKPGDVNSLSNSLKELIDSELLRKKLSESSKQLIKKDFNINLISKQLEYLYLTLL